MRQLEKGTGRLGKSRPAYRESRKGQLSKNAQSVVKLQPEFPGMSDETRRRNVRIQRLLWGW